MTMVSDLIDAHIQNPADPAVHAALADALGVTGPLQYVFQIWQAERGRVRKSFQYWNWDDKIWGPQKDIPAAADTPIPR